LATAVLAACALGWAAPAFATNAKGQPVVELVQNDHGVADQGSSAPVRTDDDSRADSRPNGSASAAFLAAFLLAGVTAVLVVAASRVSSG
jgi:hypothetical protein